MKRLRSSLVFAVITRLPLDSGRSNSSTRRRGMRQSQASVAPGQVVAERGRRSMPFGQPMSRGQSRVRREKATESRVPHGRQGRARADQGNLCFVSFNPGVELIVEAYDGYWRKTPAVRRLVFKSVPDESTRLAMLKRDETDVAYSIRGPNAEEAEADAGPHPQGHVPDVHRVAPVHRAMGPEIAMVGPARSARRQPRDRQEGDQRGGVPRIQQAGAEHHPARLRVLLGAARAIPTIPARAKQLLAEAGFPKGFDAVELATDAVFAPEAEAVINGLQAIGIRARLRTLERAGFYKADQEKQFKHLVRVGSAAAGNVATRIEAFVISGGSRAYGGYPDIDARCRDQAEEMDRKRREAMLHKIQQLMHERAMFAPILEPAFLIGVGPRMGEVPTIAGHPYVSPYEDLTLKDR